MQPRYVRKADPMDRTTWMDNFIALEPRGGVRDVVEMARPARAMAILVTILSVGSESNNAAA